MMWEESDKMLKSFDVKMLGKVYPDYCPCCGSSGKHVYFHRFDEDDQDGGVWMWCSKCHSYSHAHAVIPASWENPPFVNEDKLDGSVDYLEMNKELIDDWVNSIQEDN